MELGGALRSVGLCQEAAGRAVIMMCVQPWGTGSL